MCVCVCVADPLHVVSFIFNKSSSGAIRLQCNVTIHEDFIDRLADVAVVIEQQHNHSITPVLTFTANNITVSAVVRESGLYKCIATIDGISKSRTIIIDGSNTNNDNSDRVKNILLGGLGVVGFLCVVMCSLLFFICCQCPQRSANSSYSNMVSKNRIGARLSTNSCASADFVFNKSLVGNHLNRLHDLVYTISQRVTYCSGRYLMMHYSLTVHWALEHLVQ